MNQKELMNLEPGTWLSFEEKVDDIKVIESIVCFDHRSKATAYGSVRIDFSKDELELMNTSNVYLISEDLSQEFDDKGEPTNQFKHCRVATEKEIKLAQSLIKKFNIELLFDGQKLMVNNKEVNNILIQGGVIIPGLVLGL